MGRKYRKRRRRRGPPSVILLVDSEEQASFDDELTFDSAAKYGRFRARGLADIISHAWASCSQQFCSTELTCADVIRDNIVCHGGKSGSSKKSERASKVSQKNLLNGESSQSRIPCWMLETREPFVFGWSVLVSGTSSETEQKTNESSNPGREGPAGPGQLDSFLEATKPRGIRYKKRYARRHKKLNGDRGKDERDEPPEIPLNLSMQSSTIAYVNNFLATYKSPVTSYQGTMTTPSSRDHSDFNRKENHGEFNQKGNLWNKFYRQVGKEPPEPCGQPSDVKYRNSYPTNNEKEKDCWEYQGKMVGRRRGRSRITE